MTAAMPILAAGGEDPTVKIIIGVAVAVFWIIAQVAGAIGKKKDQTLPPPMPRRQPPQRPPQRQPQANRQQPKQRRQNPQPPRRQPPPLRQQTAAQVPVGQATAYDTKAETAAKRTTAATEARRVASQSSATSPPVLPRREMINALLRPKNLKRALIVNELLQPPLALRGERE